ncbi:HEAT repeat domain-containing protein [Peribacillus sp. 1P06PB]|uniref:HEAT repeat domain-containing protein n=1 Tax=Peribacillus sp. 1P06PB TaxID=3132296 RepID=UPI0039A20E0D
MVEAIGDLNEIKGLEHLYEALTDKEEIVRGYAAEGIGKIGKAASIPILEKYLKYETSSLSKLGFFVGLGERKYLRLMLDLLKDPSYRVRCAVANSVVDLLNQENVYLIKQSLLFALKNEQTDAACSSLQGALEEINS